MQDGAAKGGPDEPGDDGEGAGHDRDGVGHDRDGVGHDGEGAGHDRDGLGHDGAGEPLGRKGRVAAAEGEWVRSRRAFDLAECPFDVLWAIGEADQDDLLAAAGFGAAEVDGFLEVQASAIGAEAPEGAGFQA